MTKAYYLGLKSELKLMNRKRDNSRLRNASYYEI